MGMNLPSLGTVAIGGLLPIIFTIWLTLKIAMRSYDLTSHRLATACCILLLIAFYSLFKMLGLS